MNATRNKEVGEMAFQEPTALRHSQLLIRKDDGVKICDGLKLDNVSKLMQGPVTTPR